MKAPVLAIAIAVLAAAANPANATATFHEANNEAGGTVHVVPGTITRLEREALERAELASADPNWAYRGEEAGWELVPHSYEFRGGRLEHSDRIPHDAAPSVANGNVDYRHLERD